MTISLRVSAAALCGIAVAAGIGCRNPPLTTLERLVDACRLAADMSVQFTKSVDAGNRAVMADTDETSTAFAGEANAAAEAVTASAGALAPILQGIGYAEEGRLLEEFNQRFADYRTLDGKILQLAVENTNLKALRLSFGPAQQEADRFGEALNAAVRGVGRARAPRAETLAALAMLSVREIQVLEGPHIAESDEANMATLEKKAADLEAAARRDLAAIGALVPPKAKTQLAEASAALDRFAAVNAEIVTLSRRNSNVRSVALSLGEKRTLTAACEDSVRALQDALATRGFTGTK